MTDTPAPLRSSTRTINPELSALLRRLRPGQRIRITQTVRVGSQVWTTNVIRESCGFSVSPTARLSILKPREASMPET